MKRALLIASAVLLVLIIAMYAETQRILAKDCMRDGEVCEAHRSPINFLFLLAIAANSAVLGLSLSCLKGRRKVPKGLEGDEKRVVEYLLGKGPSYQSAMAKDLGMSKVKMTRVLDKLEAKGVVERKRHGMTNLVVLRGDDE